MTDFVRTPDGNVTDMPEVPPPAARTDYAEPHNLWSWMLLFAPVHEAWGALRWVGMRDRLRCTECKAVGTWKPHGTLWDRWVHHDRPVRRWMCKWCGLYVGPEGILRAFPDKARGHWALPRQWDPPSPAVPGPTPADVLREAMGKTWPWNG
jgi:hypothetical protein